MFRGVPRSPVLTLILCPQKIRQAEQIVSRERQEVILCEGVDVVDFRADSCAVLLGRLSGYK